jgi:hypothetical protein
MIPDGWHYVPHGSPEPVQTVAPMIGGPADGSCTDIGAVEELPDHIEVPGNEHMHYYAIERRGHTWAYVFVMSERRALA